jgi:aconitase A
MTTNSFGARDRLEVGDAAYEIFRLDRVDGSARLPYSLKVLLETCGQRGQHLGDRRAGRRPGLLGPAGREWHGDPVHPARVLLQDFTGVPCVVDLVAMREQFKPGQSRASLGLTGEELYSITGLEGTDPLPHEVTVRAEKNGDRTEFTAAVRIDTPAEAVYFRLGGILQFVLRQLLETNDTRR